MKKPGIFYGYRVLVACFILNIISAGCGLASFSFFITSLQDDLGWSRGDIMVALTLFQICCATASPFVGRLVDRYGARRIMITGAALAAAGFILLSQMDSLWQYYLGYVIAGVGLTSMGPVASSFVVSQWFVRRRGTAIGVMSMGIGLTGIIFSFLVIVFLIPSFGWGNAYLAYAVLAGGIAIPLSVFVIRTRPSDLGLHPDGLDASQAAIMADASRPVEGLTLKMAAGTSSFWLLAAFLWLFHNHSGIMQSQVPRLSDLGFPASIAALTYSTMSIAATSGMFFFGWLCDRAPVKLAAITGTGFIIAAILIFLNIGSGSPVWMIVVYAAVLGFGVGSWMPTMSMLTITTFGHVSYGAIFGMMSLFQNFGAATGPLLAGYVYDSTGGYALAYIIILAMLFLAVPILLAVRRRTRLPSAEKVLGPAESE